MRRGLWGFILGSVLSLFLIVSLTLVLRDALAPLTLPGLRHRDSAQWVAVCDREGPATIPACMPGGLRHQLDARDAQRRAFQRSDVP